MPAESGEATEYPGWWPNGVDEAIVRDCNCSWCDELAEKLDAYRRRTELDEQLTGLDSFAGA